MTNLVLTALIMVNGASIGHEFFEVVPDTYRDVVKTCEACKNGWAPFESPCTCEYKYVQTGTYHLEPRPDFKTPIRSDTMLYMRVVNTNSTNKTINK